LKICQ